MKHYTTLLIVVVAAGGAHVAHADDDTKSDTLTLPKGGLLIDVALEVQLSKGVAGKPISLAPDLWYGATDDLTLGLVHSGTAETGLLGGVGDALCLTSSSCPHFYPGLGIDVRYRLAAPFNFDGGLVLRDTDPFQLALKLGISGRWHLGKAAVEIQPNLFIGLTNRAPAIDPVTMTGAPANKEVLTIPLTGYYEVAEHFDLAAQLGLALPFSNAGDTFRVPLSLAAHYQVNDHVGLGLVFSLPALLGGSKIANGLDARTLMLGGSYAL